MASRGSGVKFLSRQRPYRRPYTVGFGSLRQEKCVTQTLSPRGGRRSVLAISSSAGFWPGKGGVFHVQGRRASCIEKGLEQDNAKTSGARKMNEEYWNRSNARSWYPTSMVCFGNQRGAHHCYSSCLPVNDIEDIGRIPNLVPVEEKSHHITNNLKHDGGTSIEIMCFIYRHHRYPCFWVGSTSGHLNEM